MMKHGGIYHHYYQSSKTTHIIATNLPDTKIKKLKTMNVVKPDWIVDSIAAGQLLDYRQYLLYSRQSKTQPGIMFKHTSEVENKPTTSTVVTESRDPCDEREDKNHNFNEMDYKDDACSDSSHSYETNEIESITDKINTNNGPKQAQSIKTASEAGFLNEFYSNSRLHHISTMGATFKQYVNNLRQNKTGVFEGAEKLKLWKQNKSGCSFQNNSPYKSVIMHIDMDCFFASVGLRKRPNLQGFPVAVTHAKAGSGQSSSRAGVDRKAEFELYKTRREAKVQSKNPTIENKDIKPWSDWVETIDESNSMSEIASCNYEARKYGLKNGMFLGQALKLCPNLKTIPYDFEGYKEVSYALYDTVARYYNCFN